MMTSMLPEWGKKPLRRLRDIVKAVADPGLVRFCPVCGKTSPGFHRFGVVSRDDAQCPQCLALERHRLLWLYVSRRTNLFDGAAKKVLHVAPEKCFEPRFKERLGDSYLTADLYRPDVMAKMDITNIEWPDQSFDVIYCSHVLEHVQDDKKAIREFFRVLKDNGWAILLVPITGEKTIEDPTLADPQERTLVFGQEDHVRVYGPDYIDRLMEAGFKVKTTRVDQLVEREEARRMGLTQASGEIYYCTK